MEDHNDNNTEAENDLSNDLEMENADISEDVILAEESEEFKEEVSEAVAGVDTSKISEEINEEIEEIAAAKVADRTQTVSATAGSSALPKLFLLFGIILAIGAGLVYWKNTVAGHHGDDLTHISKQEMEALLDGFNPMQLKQLSENPDQKKQLTDNISELLAIASQARKEGYDQRPEIKNELESMEVSLFALAYDQKVNGDKGPMPPFGFIGEDKVKEYWGEGKEMSGFSWIWNGAEARRREAEFQQFINAKIELLRKGGQIAKDQEPSEEELKQARDAYAKTQISYNEAKQKLAGLNSMSPEERKEWEEWKEKTEFQMKLQEAQFLVQNYFNDVVKKKLEVTDAEVKQYVVDHPELANTADKKKKADEILKKIKEGADFGELAKEFSEDPGSKDNGGLYEGVAKGQFAPEFEQAALALKPGEVADQVVKTDFGYHIIKLEKISEAKGANGQAQPTYDARHILISTMVKDPENPAAREMPAEQFVKAKLEKEKQEKVLAEIKANNPIEIADFEIPKVSEEELKKMQEEQMKRMQQMQQQQGGGGAAPPPPPPPPPAEKPAPKAEQK